MPELVRDHVRLREVSRRAELVLQLVVEPEVDVDLLVVGAVEGPHRRLPDAAAGLASRRGRARASRRGTARRTSAGRSPTSAARRRARTTRSGPRAPRAPSRPGASCPFDASMVGAAPVSSNRLRPKRRLSTSRTAVPPMPMPMRPNPPPPRRSSMLELRPMSLHFIAASSLGLAGNKSNKRAGSGPCRARSV